MDLFLDANNLWVREKYIRDRRNSSQFEKDIGDIRFIQRTFSNIEIKCDVYLND